MLRELAHSGLSMAEFCRRRGLPYGTVAAWRGMARRAPIRFIEIVPEPVVEQTTLPPEESRGLCAELTLPGGAVLRVYQRAGQGGAA